MDEKTVRKYLSNNCTEGELKKVLDWLDSSGDTPECRKLLWQAWESLGENDSEIGADFEAILAGIHEKVNLMQPDGLSGTGKIYNMRPRRWEYFTRNLRNVAAALLVPVLGLSLFYSVKYYSIRSDISASGNSYNEVFSSVDAITKVLLPDSTIVWLNHSSSLRYPVVFDKKYRKVDLIGEGYFEVASNVRRPFVVNAGDIDIVAVGTSFNVMAYPEENRIETSLIEGKVEIWQSSGTKNTTICEMKPEDMVVYYRESGEVATRTIRDDRYFSWKEGKLVFTAEPMSEVVTKLSRWFNVDIEISDPAVADLTLTATFINESLISALDLIAKVSPVDYTISGRDMNTDGTFNRRKVSINYRVK